RVHRARRAAVRVLHAGADHVGGRAARRGPRDQRRRGPRADERQHLPVRRLQPHHPRDPVRAPDALIGHAMPPFVYVRPDSVDQALASGRGEAAHYVAGGTTLIDLMRLEVMQPRAVVDLTGLAARGLAAIESYNGGLRIGALATNTDVAYH